MKRASVFISSLVSLSLFACLGFDYGWTMQEDCLIPNTLAVPQLQSPRGFPTRLDARPWTDAAQITGFLDIQGKAMAANQTQLFLFYTNDSLWAAFRCIEPEGGTMIQEVTERDGPVWRDSSVEIFLDPVHSHHDYFQLVVNPLGAFYDGRNMDGTWNSTVEVQSVTDNTGWTAFFRIPFADLGSVPDKGDMWAANFCRSRTIEERTSWSRLIGAYTDPVRFGHILFAGKNFKPAQINEIAPIRMGQNTFPVQKDEFRYHVEGVDSKFETPYSTEGASRGKCSFILDKDQVKSLTVTLQNKRGELLARMLLPMESSPMSGLLLQLQRTVSMVREHVNGFPEDIRGRMLQSADSAQKSLDEASQMLATPDAIVADQWESKARTLRGLQMRLNSARALAETLALFPDARFGVGFESPMKKVLIKDVPFDGWFATDYDLSLARYEHESLQIVVLPFDKAVKNVTVEASGLTKSGASQPSPSVQAKVSLVGHIRVEHRTPYEKDVHDWWPDPLLDFQQSCDVNPDEQVSFWITVSTQRDTQPGDYQGRITVSADDSPPVTLTLNVHVWDFEMPLLTSLRNAFTFDVHAMRKFYRDKRDQDMVRKYHDFLLDYRLNIDHLYRSAPEDIEVLKYGATRGMNAFNICFTNGPERIKTIDEFVPQLKESGLYEYAYVYGFDEVKKEKFPEIKMTFGEIHRRHPGLKTMTTADDKTFGKQSGLRDYVDIWVPLTCTYDLNEAEQLRAEGKEMWWYICVNPFHPYANWFIEYPAIESRLLTGSMSYMYKTGGFLYYLVNLWGNNKERIESGPYTNWNGACLEYRPGTLWANGDGSLLCPGPDGPLSTIRLENIRDGFEDYDYFMTLLALREKAATMEQTESLSAFIKQADAALQVPQSLVKSLTEFTYDPEEVYANRTRIAEAILAGNTLIE